MKSSAKNNDLFKPFKNFPLHHSTTGMLLTGSLLFLLGACGESTDTPKKNLKSEMVSREKSSLNASNNCLDQYYGRPEALLTKELIGTYVDFEGAEVAIAKVSEQIIKDKDFAQVNCKWKINRQRRIVRLSQISKIKLYQSKTPKERFYDKYHTRTPEERAALKKSYDSLVLQRSEVKKKTDRSTVALVTKAIGFDFQYLNVEGIADAAVWEHKVNDLKVLVGDYQFTVNVDLDKGNDHDLEKAKLIAKALIKKACN